MLAAWRVLAVTIFALGLVGAYGTLADAQAKPRPGRTAHPASHHSKPATGAERRQTWHNTRMDLKRRFRALGHQMRRSK